MASVATSRGDINGALRLYSEAEAGTAEAIRRNPDDPERLFEHAQNVFYVGEIKGNQGDKVGAEASMREYKRLAARMVELEPNNMQWRMEVQYADTNLGVALYGQRRFAESTNQFREALRTIEAFTAAEPGNLDYQKNLQEGLAWVATSQLAEGRLDEATAARERQVALLGRLLRGTGDVYYRLRLIPAERSLGNLYASRGQMSLAVQHLGAAADQGRRLIPIEPENTSWRENAAIAEINLGRLLFLGSAKGDAAAHVETGCELVRGLLKGDATIPAWREAWRDCWMMRARLAFANGQKADAVKAAQQAVIVGRSIKTDDPQHDRYSLADAYRLLGDAQRGGGDTAAARASWTNALEALPRGIPERPDETGIHLRILQRLGRAEDAQPLINRLNAIGYRNPEFRGV
jgi:tetratricopeptide (TPR) repeat protein